MKTLFCLENDFGITLKIPKGKYEPIDTIIKLEVK
jgi:hypothetical protein